LDGSHVFKYILPPGWALAYARLGGYGLLIVYALLFLGTGLLMAWLSPAYMLTDFLLQHVRSFMIPWPYGA
jgi:Zn-dependent protease